MYAPVILTPQAEEWMAQNFDDFLTTYDYTGVEAMPYMEGAADHADQWMQDLIDKVAQHPLGLRRTVFELQAKDWRRPYHRPSGCPCNRPLFFGTPLRTQRKDRNV